MSKRIRRVIALENGGNVGTDNVAQNEEGAGSGADAVGSTVAGQSENSMKQ